MMKCPRATGLLSAGFDSTESTEPCDRTPTRGVPASDARWNSAPVTPLIPYRAARSALTYV